MSRFSFITVILSFSIAGWCQQFEPSGIESSVKFEIKNFGITVEGSFTGLDGAIQFDPNNLTASQVDVSLNAASVNTGIDLRDKHLRKEEYFDVKSYSEIRFVSTEINATSKAGVFKVTGNLTIKRTTREIRFEFTAQKQGTGYLFHSELLLNRRDFGVGGNSFSMADELNVLISVLAVANK